jgi:uncharacterized SAM-binding protein YcdF (DUF218 family)
MYFIFSKILLFLLFPLSWIVAFLFITLFAKRPKLKKRSLVTAVVLLIVFSNPYLLHMIAKSWDIDPVPLNKGKVYSAAIILGGFSGEDKNGHGFFNENADRFIQGVKLKTTGQVSRIMISGGNGNLQPGHFTEGGWVKGELKEFKLPDSVILVEQRSRNTFENAAFSKAILEQAHLPPPYLLVTSSWHMRRSLYIFKKAGLDVIPYPCGRLAGNNKLYINDYWMPDAVTLTRWNIYLKEFVGMAVTRLKYVM